MMMHSVKIGLIVKNIKTILNIEKIGVNCFKSFFKKKAVIKIQALTF